MKINPNCLIEQQFCSILFMTAPILENERSNGWEGILGTKVRNILQVAGGYYTVPWHGEIASHLETMKSSGDQSQQFNTTLVIAGIIALVLAATLVFVIYGCMKTAPNPPVKQTRAIFTIENIASSIVIAGQELKPGINR